MKKYPVCLVLTGYCSIRAFKASKPSVGWLNVGPSGSVMCPPTLMATTGL